MLKNNKKTSSVVVLLKKDLKIPDKENMFFTLENNGNAIFDYLLKIALTEKVTECFISSFRIAKRDLSFLEELIKKEKLPNQINLLLSDSIKTMVVGTYNYLKDNENFKTNYKNTHSKYALLKTEEGNNYCIFSSGNFNPDGKIEQLTIFNSEETFLFYKKFIESCQEEKEI